MVQNFEALLFYIYLYSFVFLGAVKRRRRARRERAQKKRRDKKRPTGSTRADSEDDSFRMDKLSQDDWANFEGEHPKGIPEIEVDKDFE